MKRTSGVVQTDGPTVFMSSSSGAPGKAAGFVGERRSSGMSEFSRKRGNEGYKACDDEDDVAEYPGMKAFFNLR